MSTRTRKEEKTGSRERVLAEVDQRTPAIIIEICVGQSPKGFTVYSCPSDVIAITSSLSAR